MADNVVEVIIRARDEASKTFASFEDRAKSLQGVLVGVSAAAAAVTGAFLASANATANLSDEALALSAASGQSVENMSRLGFAAKQAEADIQTLATGLRFLQRSQQEALAGNDKTAAAFTRLGISAQQLRSLDARQLFLAVADGLSGIENAAERTALRIDLLGRGGNALASLLSQGSAGIQEMEARSDELRATLSTTAAVMGDAFGDAADQARAALVGLRTEVSTAVLPLLTEMATRFAESVAGLTRWASENRATVSAIFQVAAAVTALLGPLTAAISLVGGLRLAALALGVSLGGSVAIGIGLAVAALGVLAVKLVEAREKALEPFDVKINLTSSAFALDAEIGRVKGEIEAKRKEIEDLERRARASTRTSAPSATTAQAQQSAGDIPQSQLRQRPADAKLVIDTREATANLALAQDQLSRLERTLKTYQGTREQMSRAQSGEFDPTAESAKAARAEVERFAAFLAGIRGESVDIVVPVSVRGTEEGRAKLEAFFAGAEALTAKPIDAEIKSENFDRAAAALERMNSALAEQQDLAGPFREANVALDAFLQSAGLAPEEIEKIGASLRLVGKDADAVAAGTAAGFAALGKQIEEGFLNPAVVVAQGVFNAYADLTAGIGELFGDVFLNIFTGAKSVGDSMRGLFNGLFNLVARIAAQIVATIIQAKILAATLGSVGGGPLGFIGGLLGFSRGGTVRAATGGTVAALAGGGTVPRLAGGATVFGSASRADDVPLLLSRGETALVLPTIAGRTPDALLGRLADLSDRIGALLSDGKRPQGGSEGKTLIQNWNISALHPQQFRDEIRWGGMRDEWDRALELGRI